MSTAARAVRDAEMKDLPKSGKSYTLVDKHGERLFWAFGDPIPKVDPALLNKVIFPKQEVDVFFPAFDLYKVLRIKTTSKDGITLKRVLKAVEKLAPIALTEGEQSAYVLYRILVTKSRIFISVDH